MLSKSPNACLSERAASFLLGINKFVINGVSEYSDVGLGRSPTS